MLILSTQQFHPKLKYIPKKDAYIYFVKEYILNIITSLFIIVPKDI